MIKLHKNILYQVIRDSSLDVSLFEFVPCLDKLLEYPITTRVLNHAYYQELVGINLRNSPMWFIIVGEPDLTYDYQYTTMQPAFFTPGFSEVGDKNFTTWANSKSVGPSGEFDITQIAYQLRNWVNLEVDAYLRELSAPDLWEQAASISIDFAPRPQITEADTEPFTDREKETIRLQMKEFKRLLAQNLETTTEQQAFINERLDYLTKAVDKLNRFDWKALALSTLISISIQLTLDTEKGKLLFALFEQAMHTVIRFLGGQ